MSSPQVSAALARLEAAADLAAARGSLIFHLDLATELARAALAAAGFDQPRLATLVGAQGYEVVALEGTATARIVAAVGFDGTGRAIVSRPNTPASALVEILAHARRTAATAAPATAPGDAAIIVLPPPPDRGPMPLEAYAIALAATPGAIRLGPHFLLRLSPDGRRLDTRTLLSSETTELPPLPPPRRSHIALDHPDAVPSELHTYLGLKHDIDLAVTTRESGLTWHVSGERSQRL